MKEKELKTSVGQRVAISIIAFFMLGSVIASYAAIIVGNSNNQSNASETQKLSEERMAYYQDNYASKLAKFKETTKEDVEQYLNEYYPSGIEKKSMGLVIKEVKNAFDRVDGKMVSQCVMAKIVG